MEIQNTYGKRLHIEEIKESKSSIIEYTDQNEKVVVGLVLKNGETAISENKKVIFDKRKAIELSDGSFIVDEENILALVR